MVRKDLVRKKFYELLRYAPSMCMNILRMDAELNNLNDEKNGILQPADLDATMLSDPASKSPRDSEFLELVMVVAVDGPLLRIPKLDIENVC